MAQHPKDPDQDSVDLDPSNPADTSPLTIERTWVDEGRDGEFTVMPGARLRCETCGHVSEAREQDADDAARTEGVSDPADMTIVLRVCCPSCRTCGVLTLSYGPESDPDTSDFVAAVPRDPRRADSTGTGGEVQRS